MPDQTGATRRALAAMYPAAWDDPYTAFCNECGREVDPTTAHSPHEEGCPRVAFGAAVCLCDRTVCPRCCEDCAPGGEGMIAVVLVLVLLLALLSIVWQGEPVQAPDRLCPDFQGACIYEAEPGDG